MSESDNNKKLDEILEIIKRASVLDGGFDRLTAVVEEIKDENVKILYDLQLVKTNQNAHTEKIDKMYNSLYDPDHGLYRRVASTVMNDEIREEEFEEIKAKTESIKTEQSDLQKQIDSIEKKYKAIERVAGDDLHHLRSIISTRKTMIRTIWIFAAGAIVGLTKFLWEVLG